MNAQLTLCLGSMTFVLVVTLIVTARIARRTFALQKIARIQEQRRKQAEADSAAAWAARKPIKPSGYYPGHSSVAIPKSYRPTPERLVPDQIWQNGELISRTPSKLSPSMYGHPANSTNFTRRFTGWPDRESRLDRMYWRDMEELYAMSPACGPTALRHDNLTDRDLAEYAEYSSMAYHMGVDAGYGK